MDDALAPQPLGLSDAEAAARFAQGMTFDQYVAWTATPESLARESSPAGAGRAKWSEHLRRVYEATRLTPAQQAAWEWLVKQPDGPARVLAISEEWSSDCRRDIPVIARVAATAGLELRIFPHSSITLILFSNQDNGAYDDLKRNVTKLITGER